jgi:hypothetical protein
MLLSRFGFWSSLFQCPAFWDLEIFNLGYLRSRRSVPFLRFILIFMTRTVPFLRLYFDYHHDATAIREEVANGRHG